MKKIIQIANVLFISALLFSCGSQTTKEESKVKIDLSSQEFYEGFLAQNSITIHEKASFERIKKTNDGNYKIIYKVEPFENIQDSLQAYYEEMFDKALLSKGWEKPESGWGQHGTVYTKDDNFFKFFVLVSEKHDVYELAFKYGQ
ncbi:MAG: hypothetical protein JEY96_02910 [Bacteroidales bacterium]|nr:hypothetical protein [Bacteroidales bacterium]